MYKGQILSKWYHSWLFSDRKEKKSTKSAKPCWFHAHQLERFITRRDLRIVFFLIREAYSIYIAFLFCIIKRRFDNCRRPGRCEDSTEMQKPVSLFPENAEPVFNTGKDSDLDIIRNFKDEYEIGYEDSNMGIDST